MARFDPDAAYRFKRGPRGEIVFFPRGIWGTGYVVPDETRAESIAHHQNVLHRWADACAILIFALSPFGGWRKLTLFFAALAVTRTVAQWRLRRSIVGLPMSDTRLSLRDILAQQKADLIAGARGTSWWVRVALVLVFVALVTGTGWLAVVAFIVAAVALAMSVPR